MKHRPNYTRNPKPIHGFTLIELLVVISIIALLLSIIVPSLRKANEIAKAVICSSNLRQWNMCYQLYATDSDGLLPVFVGNAIQCTYMYSLRNYYDDINEMRTCPMATQIDPSKAAQRISASNSYWGSTTRAWQVDTSTGWMEDDDWGIGSYTENSWVRKMDENETDVGRNTLSWERFTKMTSPSLVPMIMDGRWNNAWPISQIPGPVQSEEAFYGGHNFLAIDCVVMRRHGEGINIAMGDGSCQKVDIENLWALKWHKDFEPQYNVDLSWITW